MCIRDRCTEPDAAQQAQYEKDDAQYEEENPMASEKDMEARREARFVQRALDYWGEPLHSLILVGRRLHPMEVEYGRALALPGSRWADVAQQVYGAH